MGKILVIGAANIDLIAIPDRKLRMRDSNIGKANISFGGVGRNIVENLARLGHEVHFMTALGSDPYGVALRNDLEKLGVSIEESIFAEERSGYYLAICDADGDMRVAVCDNEINESLNPEYLQAKLDYINSFEHLVFDTNLTAESLRFLFENTNGKIYLDATSVTKGNLIEPYLSKISVLKGNRVEIKSLAKGKDNIEAEIKSLLAIGVERVIVTSGPGPVYYNLNGKIEAITPPPAKPVSTTGSGDAFLSGVIHGILLARPFSECIVFGIKAAATTMKVYGACNPDLKKYL
jgi:pseudouridine kinase